MLLSDLLKPESIVIPLDIPDRESAIAALVGALDLPGTPAAREELKAAVIARETAGSTGMGNGIAIPHARSSAVSSPRLAIGRTSRPIDFKSADGKPVTLIFLLVVPASQPTSHLKALAALSRLVSDKNRLKALNKASTAAEIFELAATIPV